MNVGRLGRLQNRSRVSAFQPLLGKRSGSPKGSAQKRLDSLLGTSVQFCQTSVHPFLFGVYKMPLRRTPRRSTRRTTRRAFRPRRTWRRRGSFASRIRAIVKRSGETKYTENTYQDLTSYTLGVTQSANMQVPRGTASNARVGDKIFLKGMKYRISRRCETDATIRMVCVWYPNEPCSANPIAGLHDFPRRDLTDKYVILFDRIIKVGAGNNNATHYMSFYVPVNKTITYDPSDSVGTTSNKGHFRLFEYCSNGVTTGSMTLTHIQYYKDV